VTAPALTAEQRRRSITRQVGLWVAWIGAVILATIGMYLVRGSLDKAHVTLAYLLLVLGASAAGGRVLGLTVAALGFLCFDVYFLPPYATFTITNPLDWLILGAFLVTSAVATQLLYRANATAEAATARAIEVDRLAALGAETLNAADAYEALRAIAGVIRSSLDVDECDIYLDNTEKRVVLVARVLRASDALGQSASVDAATEMAVRNRTTPPGRLVDWIVEHGTSAVELGDGTVRVAYENVSSQQSASEGEQRDPELAAAIRVVTDRADSRGRRVRRLLDEVGEGASDLVDRPAVRALALPLKVRDRTVGVLRIASDEALSFTPEQARLLTALAYYAALGAERARLVASAERVEAERRVERLRSALLTAVSHDLRTPLTTIKGIANEILRGANREQAAVIESEADWLDGLVSDLLDLSRIQAGAVQPVLEFNTLDDLVGTALRRAGVALQGHRVEVDNPRDELLAGVFDFSQSLRVLVNLLDNAAKYSPPGSPIDVRLRRFGDRLTIDVMDRGAGIPESERERIFESFYRPPGVPPDIRGHGLGLSIARGLAEAQGGTVRVEPRPGGGSVFTLELPSARGLPVETESA
jgi:two-component system, OmpR family, sensor histidine kinase KdpD